MGTTDLQPGQWLVWWFQKRSDCFSPLVLSSSTWRFRSHFSTTGGAADAAERTKKRHVRVFFHRGAGGAQGADGQLLLLQQELWQCEGSVQGRVPAHWSLRHLGIHTCVCFSNHSGAYEWAQKTLKDHAKDKREYIYTREQLEKAKTHDKLWNAAQVCVRSSCFLLPRCFRL